MGSAPQTLSVPPMANPAQTVTFNPHPIFVGAAWALVATHALSGQRDRYRLWDARAPNPSALKTLVRGAEPVTSVSRY